MDPGMESPTEGQPTPPRSKPKPMKSKPSKKSGNRRRPLQALVQSGEVGVLQPGIGVCRAIMRQSSLEATRPTLARAFLFWYLFHLSTSAPLYQTHQIHQIKYIILALSNPQCQNRVCESKSSLTSSRQSLNSLDCLPI